ncbi:MAG TPA: type II toxin-antitoxin system VapC family toxin [Steroidobacteraceae bacterium]|nr:type II toxin-antitoxin system VapC family toxin [Steroidobacteraceae bacterium]
MIVIDASAVVELILKTELGLKVEARALDPIERLHAPHLLDLEVAQVLRRLVMLREVTVRRAQEALEDHAALLIERPGHHDLLSRIWRLRDSLSAYDAAYVFLGEALNAPVLTCDGKLARSHGHTARIELID